MSETAGSPERGRIEVRSIDYVPRAERHGKVWHQGPFWFAGNFVLVLFRDEKRSAAAASDYLNSKGIIVRPVGGYGIHDGLRITVGTEDQNRAVIDALSEFAAS